MFYPVSRGWTELGIPNLAGMSLMKSYLMLQNNRFTEFTVSELLNETQQRMWDCAKTYCIFNTTIDLSVFCLSLLILSILKYICG